MWHKIQSATSINIFTTFLPIQLRFQSQFLLTSAVNPYNQSFRVVKWVLKPITSLICIGFRALLLLFKTFIDTNGFFSFFSVPIASSFHNSVKLDTDICQFHSDFQWRWSSFLPIVINGLLSTHLGYFKAIFSPRSQQFATIKLDWWNDRIYGSVIIFRC